MGDWPFKATRWSLENWHLTSMTFNREKKQKTFHTVWCAMIYTFIVLVHRSVSISGLFITFQFHVWLRLQRIKATIIYTTTTVMDMNIYIHLFHNTFDYQHLWFNRILKYYHISYSILQLYKRTRLSFTLFMSHFVLKPANINVMAVKNARTDLFTETTCCKHCTLPMQSVKTHLITHVVSVLVLFTWVIHPQKKPFVGHGTCNWVHLYYW